MEITSEGIRAALGSNPTLTLLKAYSGDWVLPLFAELEQIDGSVSAEWFHERVSEARAQIPEWQRNVTPAEYCRDWVEKRCRRQCAVASSQGSGRTGANRPTNPLQAVQI